MLELERTTEVAWVKGGVTVKTAKSADDVVAFTSSIDDTLGVHARLDGMEAKELIPELALESLDERILERLVRPVALKGDDALRGAELEGPAGALRLTVAPSAAGGMARHDGARFGTVVIDDDESPKRAAVSQVHRSGSPSSQTRSGQANAVGETLDKLTCIRRPL